MVATWDELVFESPYLAVEKAKQLLRNDQMADAYTLLECLSKAMGRSEKRAVSSLLTRLMCFRFANECKASPIKRLRKINLNF